MAASRGAATAGSGMPSTGTGPGGGAVGSGFPSASTTPASQGAAGRCPGSVVPRGVAGGPPGAASPEAAGPCRLASTTGTAGGRPSASRPALTPGRARPGQGQQGAPTAELLADGDGQVAGPPDLARGRHAVPGDRRPGRRATEGRLSDGPAKYKHVIRKNMCVISAGSCRT